MPTTPCGSALYLWSDAALYVGGDLSPAMHRHNAVECAVALDGPFRVQSEDGVETKVTGAVLVDANVLHRVSSPGHAVAFLYLEKTAFAVEPAPDGISALRAPVGEALRDRLNEARKGKLGNADTNSVRAEILSLFAAHIPSGPPRDPRIEAVLAHIAAHPGAQPRGAELADIAGLSPGRLQHLFKAHVGMPVRRYLLWFRIRRVIEILHDGADLTRAAHEAGFSDSAHFSRTFKAMVGIPPSEIFGRRSPARITLCNR